MRTEDPRPVRLKEYRAPDFMIDEIALDLALDPTVTRVKSRLTARRTGAADAPLALDGEGLELVSIAVDGKALPSEAYALDAEKLVIGDLPDAFTLEIENSFSPEANTALSGIYMSGGRFFSQCEAEGFRRITFFPDRPDVLARYRVRVEADRAAFPILLSNGNREEAGELADGRHYAVWRDPFPKPCYLFALVGGDFDVLEDAFTTMSGKRVPLRIYVDKGDAPRAAYAMDALKRAMKWDEEAFGREYDLDLFMIVAVRDFNFGAMENKGLNIFNSSLLLADPDTATDYDFEAIESVVAHEYFHNWTGDRITCRDWFQLCLKEGLTVFRDQEFSAHERGAAIARIKDVKALRARQFPEDAGPLAHPVRPAEYLKIDNFYTATVYEKGAEVIRVLQTLVGPEVFAKGMDLYFERCDGTAATVEEFLACFADASGRDLKSFLSWYEQAGTPRVTLKTRWDEAAGALDVALSQATAPTPRQPHKGPVPIPVRLGLLSAKGEALPVRLDGENEPGPPERVLELAGDSAAFRIVGLPERPVVSALRGFSAPAVLETDEPAADRRLRAAHDPDPFNRWEAGHAIGRDLLVAMTAAAQRGDALKIDPAYVEIVAEAIGRADADLAFAGLALLPPDEGEIAQAVNPVDPAAIRAARRELMRGVAAALETELAALHDRLAPDGPFAPDAAGAGRRSARNASLRLLAELGPDAGGDLAWTRFEAADNMTDAMAALVALDVSGSARFDEALQRFYERWRDTPLVIDKWFGVQARTLRADALDRVRSLIAHPDYDERTPNRVRAVLGVLAMANPPAFHDPSGDGYALFIERVRGIDAKNPALAARLLGALEIWPRLEPGRRALAKAALESVRDAKDASRNLYEIAARSLDAAA